MKKLAWTILAAMTMACTGNDSGDRSASARSLPSGEIGELVFVDEVVGEGEAAQNGQTAVVHYTGWLYDPDTANRRGTKFDSSVDRGLPFSFPLGAGRVIRGWDEGVAGMRVGGTRLLFIPPELGYGARGAGDLIPANATLTFEVELITLR